jgi:hypothetical protein
MYGDIVQVRDFWVLYLLGDISMWRERVNVCIREWMPISCHHPVEFKWYWKKCVRIL